MVEIDVKRALALKTYCGDLSFEYEAESGLLDVPYVAFSSPVQVNLHYEIEDDGKTQVTGTVSFSLKGLCSRCLSEAERSYTGEVFAVFTQDEPRDEEYAYHGGRIKLDEAVRDAVMFALPNQFLCGNACDIPDYN